MRAFLIFVASAGCVEPDLVDCGNGVTCPRGTFCSLETAPDVCVSADQIAACLDIVDGAACATGWCDHGACVPITCGNARVDVGEICDDGNQRSGDGCAGDCRSNEACGNGVVDGSEGELCDQGDQFSHDGCDGTCKLEAPSWTQLSIDKIDRRVGAMAWDAARHEAVWFGGNLATSAFTDDTWLWNGDGWRLAPAGAAPSARSGHAMVYEAKRDRVLLFGGTDANAMSNENWVWQGAWTLLPPGSEIPNGRVAAAMAYDPDRDRTVMYGGSTGSPSFSVLDDDTWEWDGTAWHQQAPAHVPPKRLGAAIGYDRDRHVMVLFGGRGATPAPSAPLGDVWEYDGHDWTEVTVAGPVGRANATFAWDAAAHALILFGGTEATAGNGGVTFTSPGPLVDETWSYANRTWTQLAPTNAPTARAGHSMIVDDTGILVYGAVDAETWHWANAAWTDVTTPKPTAQSPRAVAYDTRRGRAVILDAGGGAWESDSGGWTKLPNPPFNLVALAYEEARGTTLALGSGTARWDGTQWTTLAAATTPPTTGAAMTYDASRDRVVLVVQGTGGNDTWEWDGVAWTQVMVALRPTGATQFALGYDPIRRCVVMFGGLKSDATGKLDNTWTFDGSSWTLLSPASSPSPRDGVAFAWSPARRRLALFGGESNNSTLLHDTWEWDGTTWSFVALAGQPPQTRGAVAWPNRDGNGIVIFGGLIASSTIAATDATWQLGWGSSFESCDAGADLDGDGLAGCADPDCWYVCSPTRPPGT